jgi:DNA (cytosine-5)-methyltransferase 1
MKHGSLFSGIGGFDLAAEWIGWENIFHCEWNSFGQKVLKHHFPNAISYEDITKTDFSIHRGAIDIISGGFPCQPYSSAGKRMGKEDERHLWPEMLRAIREIQPSWVVGENVRGLTNWNGGLVFDEVQSELETEGYEVLPFLLPACAVNAPHRRDRIWFVAYSDNSRTNESVRTKQQRKEINKKQEGFSQFESGSNGSNEYDTNPNSSGLETNNIVRESEGEKLINGLASENLTTNTNSSRCENRNKQYRGESTQSDERQHSISRYSIGINEQYLSARENRWEKFPTKSPICGGDDGLPRELDNITFSKWRNESIKAYGNAIVPQVAYQIFKSIEEMNKLK